MISGPTMGHVHARVHLFAAVLVTLKFLALPAMWFHFVFVLVLCVQWHPSASSRLRREGGGKDAAMGDVLKVAQGAHKAAEIYAQAKHSAASNSAANDVYLVCVSLFFCARVDESLFCLFERQMQ